MKYYSISFLIIFLCFLKNSLLFGQDFTAIETNITGMNSGSMDWGDYDSDGDLDLLICGNDTTRNYSSRIYRNDGNDSFTEVFEPELIDVSGGSAEWGDYDNDGDLDFLMCGEPDFLFKIYRNNAPDSSGFSELPELNIQGNSGGTATWGDYNNDGYLDILLAGKWNEGGETRIYKNNKDNSFTEQSGIEITNINEGNAEWGDYDNDGDLDIILCGRQYPDADAVAEIFRNDGDNTFSKQSHISIPANREGAISWGDFNNDAYLDILFVNGTATYVYKNNGDNTFSKLEETSFPNLGSGPSSACGDYDNDGDLDILISGSWYTAIFENNGDNSFSEKSEIELDGIVETDVSFVDYDNDGDLDIILCGRDVNNDIITKIYKNNIGTANTKPGSSTNLISSVVGNKVSLSWNEASDNETPQSSLTYNLYISSTPTGTEVYSPHADIANGYRKISRRGNLNTNSYFIKGLEAGTFYWSVQSIDNNFTGSDFASEGSFVVTFTNSLSPAEDQVIMPGEDGDPISVSETQAAESRQWKYGDYPGGPYNNSIQGETLSTYTPNFSEFKAYYVVCVSINEGVEVISNEVEILVPQFSRQTDIQIEGIAGGDVSLGDLNSDGWLDIVISGSNLERLATTKIYRNAVSVDSGFIEQTHAIPNMSNSSLALGDFNNDGNLNMLVSGDTNNWPDSYPISKIYQNVQDNFFSSAESISLNSVSGGAVAWADFDQDGDLDCFLTGYDQNREVFSKLYYNVNNDFVEAETRFREGTCVAIADYNKDSYPDILLSGRDINDNYHTSIYTNKGSGEFYKIPNFDQEVVQGGNADWGDYNNDGSLDFVLCGFSSSGNLITKIYKNNNDSTFIEQSEIELRGISDGDVEWGDYDNDGDLDLLLTGSGCTMVYKNNGDNTFSEHSGIVINQIKNSSVAWGDYNNDGDLDIILCGEGEGPVSEIYVNNCIIKNSKPEKPTNPRHEIRDRAVHLQWDSASDQETPTASLSYNVKVGSSPGASDIVSPMSLENGYKIIPALGNAFLNSEYKINKLDTGTYYWCVQTIDQGFLSSEFSEEQSFSILPAFTEQSDISLCGISNGNAIWGDYDNDGDLDILMSGVTRVNSKDSIVSKIYKNTGGENPDFSEQTEISISNLAYGNTVWGDYDNDGDLDIVLSGRDENYNTGAKVYNNNDNSFSEETGITLPEISESPTLDLKDFDNDGDLDILISGRNEMDQSYPLIYLNELQSGLFTEFSNFIRDGSSDYECGDYNNDGLVDIAFKESGTLYFFANKGELIFEEAEHWIPPSDEAVYIVSGDFDNDADLDLMLSGAEHNNESILDILQNEGSFEYLNNETAIRKVKFSSAAWGDYNNDGYLDLVIAGASGNRIAKIYRNMHDGSFSEETGISLEGVISCSVAWGDYDNDGDLDLLLSGREASSNQDLSITKIYTNNTNYSNHQASAPSNLRNEVSGYDMKLKWDKATDPDCPDGSLYYNLRIGSTPGGIDIVTPMSDLISGKRTIPAIGNTYCNTFAIIKNLIPGERYYWSVQAVDQSFTGGEWAEEQSFVVSYINADFRADTVCYGSETHFIDLSLSSGDSISDWLWYFGDGDSSLIQNPLHTYSQADTFSVQLIVRSSQETDTLFKNVIVKTNPVARFLAEPVCYGEATNYSNLSEEKGLNIAKWHWEFGDEQNSAQKDPAPHYYALAGEYTVSLYVESDNSCFDTLYIQTIVAQYPDATVTADGPTRFCTGNSVLLQAHQGEHYNYQWKLNDVPLSDSVISHCAAVYNGAYSVEIVNSLANCISESLPINIQVEPAPIAPFISVSGDTSFCEGDSAILAVPDISGYSYLWKLNGFATEITSNFCMAKVNGLYSVEVHNESGCIAESVNAINIRANKIPEQPAVSLDGPVKFCTGDSLILSVDRDEGLLYQWNNENGEILNATGNVFVSYNSNQLFVCVKSSSNCSITSDTVTVTVSEIPSKPVLRTSGYKRSDCPQEKEITIWVDQTTSLYDYNWKRNGVLLDGETDVELKGFLREGNYSILADNNSCLNESDEFSILFDKENPVKPEILAEGPNIWYLACSNDTAPTYQWLYEDNDIPDAIEFMYVAGQQLGKYEVRISNLSGCFSTSDPIWIPHGPTGIEEDPWEGLKIYPNPTPGLFTLEMANSIMGELNIDIINERGSMILNIKFNKETRRFQTQIDLSGQPSATYLIGLMLNEYRTTRSLIVE